MKIHLQMTSLGFEPRDCEHGGTFVRGDRMNATDNGWFCDPCAFPANNVPDQEFKERLPHNLPEEKDAVETVLTLAMAWGYGNMIAHIKRAWANYLIREYGLDSETALKATDVTTYPLEED